jgi:hypothetical protein
VSGRAAGATPRDAQGDRALRLGAGEHAESELAALVGAHLRKPTEAKRVVRNVFLAPAEVRVSRTRITVRLAPAGTRTELNAITEMLAELNGRRLALPGDRAGRRLRFQLQT